MMQMIKELWNRELKKKPNSAGRGNEFLAVIDPTRNNVIHASIKYSAESEGHESKAHHFSKAN